MSITENNVAPPETHKLAAIMFTDIVGFSRQMGSKAAVPMSVASLCTSQVQKK